MGGDGRVEVVSGKGCSRLFSSSIPSFRGLQPLEPMSPASSPLQVPSSTTPFAGLVICVTGLSKGVDSSFIYSIFHLWLVGFSFVFHGLTLSIAFSFLCSTNLFVCINQLLQAIGLILHECFLNILFLRK